jgi:hypothetical protein
MSGNLLRLKITLAIALAILCPTSAGRAAPVRILSSDLAFQFVCKDESRLALEDAFDGFLRHEGFKVLNLARIQREHGVLSLDVHMIGLDDKRRTVDLMSVPPAENRYAVRFRTPPPTQRASDIEDALLQVVSNKLGCELRQVTRSQNGADAADLYENEVRGIERAFREAEELEGKRHL